MLKPSSGSEDDARAETFRPQEPRLVVDLPPPFDMGFDVSADAARFLVALPTKRQRAGIEIHEVLRGFTSCGRSRPRA